MFGELLRTPVRLAGKIVMESLAAEIEHASLRCEIGDGIIIIAEVGESEIAYCT